MTKFRLISSEIIEGFIKNCKEITMNISNYFDLPIEIIETDIKNTYESINERLDYIDEAISQEHVFKDEDSGSITIHITNKCNLQCTYCYRDSSQEYQNELPIQS